MLTLLFALTFSPIASNSSVPRCAGYTVANLDNGRTVTMCGGRVVEVKDQLGNVRTIGE